MLINFSLGVIFTINPLETMQHWIFWAPQTMIKNQNLKVNIALRITILSTEKKCNELWYLNFLLIFSTRSSSTSLTFRSKSNGAPRIQTIH
jgi:hypothetical protein